MNLFFFTYGTSYQKCVVDAIKSGSAEVTNMCHSYLKPLFAFHNNLRLNSAFELPFKRIWFNYCLNSKDSLDENTCFVFYQSFHFSYSRKFLLYIKQKCPGAKLCFIFTNPIDEYYYNNFLKVRDLYDLKITFYNKDALKYNINYYPVDLGLFLIHDDFPKVDNKYDLFFVGKDKGRLGLLLDIYEQFSKQGLSCLFYIYGVKKRDQVRLEGINYNTFLPYHDVLHYVKESKAVLEILKENCNYSSIRTSEAIKFNKYLVTTNQEASTCSFYSKESVNVINSIDDIDFTFYKDQTQRSLYNVEWGSFTQFYNYITDKLGEKI